QIQVKPNRAPPAPRVGAAIAAVRASSLLAVEGGQAEQRRDLVHLEHHRAAAVRVDRLVHVLPQRAERGGQVFVGGLLAPPVHRRRGDRVAGGPHVQR